MVSAGRGGACAAPQAPQQQQAAIPGVAPPTCQWVGVAAALAEPQLLPVPQEDVCLDVDSTDPAGEIEHGVVGQADVQSITAEHAPAGMWRLLQALRPCASAHLLRWW